MDWKNKPNQIFNKVKNQMFGKGVESFHFFDQMIVHFDSDNTRVLCSHAFNLLLNKAGVFLTTQEIRNIRDIYSPKQQDCIRYRQFLEDVKYAMSEKIASLIGQAYDCLDSKGSGAVCFEHIVDLYNAKEHPHCLSRRKSPEDIKAEFYHAMKRKADHEGKISRQAFVDYYAELNFCVPNERQSFFEKLIQNTWNLKLPDSYVSDKRIKEIEHTLFEKIRLKSDGKTNQWKAGKKALSYFDLGDEKKCSFQQFKGGLDKFGCNFKEHEMKALFDKYAEGNGLDYQAFSKGIMDIDINGMVAHQNLFQTKMGTNHFKVTH